jgi:hypothetical protein
MRCDDAAAILTRRGERTPELELHLSACDECRMIAEDFAGLERAFARARAEWAPSAAFRVRLPAAPWRKLAVAACLLLVPLAFWAWRSIEPPSPSYDLGAVLEPRPPAPPPSDPEILATLFLEEGRP